MAPDYLVTAHSNLGPHREIKSDKRVLVWDIKQQRQMADLTPLGGPRDMPAILTILLMARVPLGGGRHQNMSSANVA